MSLIPSPGDGLVATRGGRAASRFEQRTYVQTRMALAQIEQAADLQAARVEAVAYVGKQGMQAVAFVSQVEQQLAQLVPLATGRLQALADITALSVAEVVGDTVRKVR
jgi:hypothetical protein